MGADSLAGADSGTGGALACAVSVGAELELLSAKGARWVPYDSFHTGYKETILQATELVSRIRLPRTRDQGARLHYYRKVGPRKAQAISKVCFAGCADFDGKVVRQVRIALGGVAPIIPRCYVTEQVLCEKGPASATDALRALAGEIAPIDDVRSTARYRMRVAENLLREFLSKMERHVGLGT